MIDLLMPILSSLILGTARAADGGDKIPRSLYVCICLVVTYYCTQSVTDTSAWMWVLCVLTMLPPHALFSALHGKPVGRGDGRWQFLQDTADKITWWLAPSIINYWYVFGIIYGTVRALLLIPAVIWLNEPWLMLAMLQGVLMWVCGKVSQTHAVRMQEFISAGFIGLMLC